MPESGTPSGLPPAEDLPSQQQFPQNVPPPQNFPPVMGEMPGIPNFNVIRRVIALFIVGAVVAGGLFALQAAKDVASDFKDTFPIDIGRSDPGNDFGSFDDPTNMSPERCVVQMRKYLKRLFFDLAEQDSDDLSAGFIEASEVFGPGSRYYGDLVDIFSNQKLSSAAALGHPKQAMKGALPLIDKACKA
jgi:hypothetical protein